MSTDTDSVPTRVVAAASALAIGFVIAAAAIALQPIGAAAGAPSATTVRPSASTSSIVTTQPLLEGSPSPGANQPTTTIGGSTGPDRSNKTTHSTNYRVWGIVAALIAVAVIVAILTWLYWQRTRPESNPSSQEHRLQRLGRKLAGESNQPRASPASAAKSDEALPRGEANGSGEGGQLGDSGDSKPGRETRDRTAELPVATGDGDAEAPEAAASEPTATEPQAEDERRQSQEFAVEQGPDGLVGRVRRPSRYADIVITVPHPDDLRGEPS